MSLNSSNGSHFSIPSVQIHEAFLERAASARGESPPGHALGAFLALREEVTQLVMELGSPADRPAQDTHA
jgi:hypothetical protein